MITGGNEHKKGLLALKMLHKRWILLHFPALFTGSAFFPMMFQRIKCSRPASGMLVYEVLVSAELVRCVPH